MTKTKTNMTDFWISVLERCGGLASAKEVAIMAIKLDAEEIQELKEGATLRACQASARKHLTSQDEAGKPASLRREVFELDEDGKTVRVLKFIQVDMANQNDWEFTVRTRMDGMRADAKKLIPLVDYGINRWHQTAEQAFQRIQQEYGYSLDDVAGEDAEEPSLV